MAAGLTFVLAGLGIAIACAAKRIVLTMFRSILSIIRDYKDVIPNGIDKRQYVVWRNGRHQVLQAREYFSFGLGAMRKRSSHRYTCLLYILTVETWRLNVPIISISKWHLKDHRNASESPVLSWLELTFWLRSKCAERQCLKMQLLSDYLYRHTNCYRIETLDEVRQLRLQLISVLGKSETGHK